jgi:hypothetical protein
MAEPTRLTLDAALEIEGREDTTQLEVKANTAQTEPLQEWQDDIGEPLGRVTGDGRIQLGDPELAAPGAVVEANQTIELPSDKPLRGLQSLGRISGAIGDAIAWAVHELQLLGGGGVSGPHTALRAVLTLNNTGDTSLAEVRAGEFEVDNTSNPVGKVAGVVSGLTNQAEGNIGEAVAFAVAPPVNQGQIDTLVGLDVPDLDQADENYAIRTGKGQAHLGDYLEMEQLAAAPAAAAGVVKIYPRTDGKLYAKTPAGVEYDLSTGGPKSGQAEIDFGATPVYGKSFTVPLSGLLPTSHLLAGVAQVAPTGKGADEMEMDQLKLTCAPGTDQFTLCAEGMEGRVYGAFTIHYIYNL